jgi:hypothetical protein
MNKKQVIPWVALVFLALTSSGCALVGTAITAGISYAIYQATK